MGNSFGRTMLLGGKLRGQKEKYAKWLKIKLLQVAIGYRLTLPNLPAKRFAHGPTTCSYFKHLSVRPVGRLNRVSHRRFALFKIWGGLMSGSRSRKIFPVALSLAVVLSLVAIGQAQDSTRKILKKVTPQYPSILKTKGIGGVVRLKVFIKPDGSVKDTELLGGNPILAESAQKAVSQWKFTPASSETNLEISVVFDPHSDN